MQRNKAFLFEISKGGNALEKVKKLTKRERLFCCFYAGNGNVREAASMAGYTLNPEQTGRLLLMRQDIQREVDRCCEKHRRDLSRKALMGYERLAFGSIADGIRLLYMENPSAVQLEEMDFFSVSEIKKPKDGAMEIKFFDRHKALEKLFDAQQTAGDGSIPFYMALQQGADALKNNNPEGCDDGI